MKNTNVNELEVNGVQYIKKDSILEYKLDGYNTDLKIVILQRGWVMIGKLERKDNECKLYYASVIRRWGTINGLGELAREGIKSETKLDKCGGLVEFDYLTVIATISCNIEKWKNYEKNY